MYDLPYYKEHDEQVINDFILQYPFAFLSGCDAESRPVVTQLPLFIEEKKGKKVLRGHIMKNTDHHKAFAYKEQVLAVFSGKHTYVSATWYSNPHSASTWNYMSVHVRGVIRFLDQQGLEELLQLTTLHFEEQNHQSPTVFNNLSDAYKQRLMRAIVAFEIEITSIDTVFKLSQNNDHESYQNIIKKLKEQDEDGRVIAAEMEKREQRLFSKS